MLIFVFNSFGFIFYFLIERENIKEKIFEEIAFLKSKEKIEVLSISKFMINEGKSFQRINRKEIRYEGKMYDIVKEEKQTDKIIFYCIHDQKEDKLERDYAKTMNENLNQKAAVSSSIHFNHMIQYADYGNGQKIKLPINKYDYFNYWSNNYLFQTFKVLTPPPKFS